MADGDSIAQVAVVILLLGLAVPGLATAYDFAGTPIAYSEDATVDYSNETAVEQNVTLEGYGDSTRITVNGTELTEGTDYDWNSDDGIVTWYNTTNTSDGETATVEYSAYQRTEESEMAWIIISPLMGLFGLFGFVAAVRALWQYVAEVWELT